MEREYKLGPWSRITDLSRSLEGRTYRLWLEAVRVAHVQLRGVSPLPRPMSAPDGNESSDMLLKAVGRRIKGRRLQQGLTQVEFAQKAGFLKQHANRVEAGRKNLNLRTLQRTRPHSIQVWLVRSRAWKPTPRPV